MTDGERPPFLREPLEHAAQRRAQDGGVLAHELGVSLAQGGQVPAARVLVRRAPAILLTGSQARLDAHPPWHGHPAAREEAGERLCRPLRSGGDQHVVGRLEAPPDLQRSLDAADRARLGDYLESVREIERRVQKMEAQDLSTLELPDVPVGTTFDQRVTLMFDMIALAYQANLTRVFSFMMAAEGSNMTYNHIGVSDAFHPLSHHQNDKARKERLVRIQTYHSQAFAKFLARLAAMPDGDGSMLDHSILLYGSNMSNSNAHDEFPLPTLVLGGGAGRIKGGQHLKYPDRTPLANLHLTLLDRVGIRVDKVGDSTQVFSEL
jgi:hypothetical protein